MDGNDFEATLLADNYVTSYRRWSFEGIDPGNHHPVIVPDEEGKVYEILDADKREGTKAYWKLLNAHASEAGK